MHFNRRAPMGGNGHKEHVEITVRPDDFYADVLREALGEVVALERRSWKRERERMQAEANEIVAALRANIAELESSFERRVAERLSKLRDGERGPPGEPGRPGEKGEPGPAGRLPIAKLWAEG